MATSIKIDESSGLQNGSGTGDANDFAENTAAGSIILDNGEPFPVLFDAALSLLAGGTGSATVSLSGYSAANPNGLPVEITGFDGGVGVNDIGWSDASGDPLNGDVALDTDGNELLTTSGSRILLYTYSTISNNILIGVNEDTGTLVFAAYLDTLAADGVTTVDDGTSDAGATSVKIWMVLYEAIDHPDFTDANDVLTLGNPLNVVVNSAIDFSLEGAPSGQNLFLMFGDGTPAADEVAIVVTGKNPLNQSDSGAGITTMDTVNSSKGGGETTLGTNNQMIDPGEGLYFTFVMGANTDYTVPNLDQNEADVEANIDFDTFFGSTSASFAVVQLQPPKKATLEITAYNETDASAIGTQFVDGLGDDDEVEITSVTIIRDVKVGKTVTTYTMTFNDDGTSSSDPTGGPLSSLSLDFTGNSVTIEGVVAGDRIIYETDGLHNRVLIDNIGNSDPNLNAAFDIGAFKLEGGDVTANPFHQLGFVDDGPTAAAALDAGMVRHDETAGNDGDADDVTGPLAAFAAVANVSTDMTAAYAEGTASVIDSSASDGGADGLASTSYSLAVFAAGVDSGLDTTEGNDILLYKEGDLVVGRISGGPDDGEAAFAVAIDSSTGVLSVVQYHSIEHPTGGASHDESISVTNGALFAVATVTDGDADPDSAQVDIGANVQFQDDGPTAAAALGAGGVAHDETAGNDGDADDVTGPLAAFAAVANASTDMTAAYALGTAAVIDSSATDFGQDGDGGTVYSLAVSAAGVDSGLDTTEGNDILLYVEGDLVVGRISGGPDDGEAAFAVAINAATGVLSMVQYHSILHPTGGASHDESLSVTNGVLFAVATVTDGDGDTHAAQVDIGARVQIQDDGPTAAAALGAGGVAHDETAGNDGDADDVTGPLAAFAGVLNASTDMTAAYALGTAAVIDSSATDFGQDGDGGTVYSLAVSAAGVDSGLDTTEGNDILLYVEGDLVVGRISGGPDDGEAAFAVAIDSSTGVLSMVQYHSIEHPTGGASHDESLSVTNGALFAVATVTDGDGDTHSAQVDIGARVSIQDDGPTLSGVDDSTNALVYASSTTFTDPFTFAPGVDGPGSPGVSLVGYTDPDDATDLAASGLGDLEALYGVDITASQVGNTVTYYTPDGGDADSDPDPLFSLTVTDSDWTFTVHQDPTLVFNVFDFSSFKAGGPVETIALEAGSGGTFGVFDGLLYGPIDAPDGTESRGIFPPAPQNPGAASTDDDLNPDELGFGIRGGAASNMNNNEGFQLTFHEGSAGGALTTVEGVQFKMDQQGNTNDVVMSFELINGTQGSGDDPDVTAIEAGAGLWLDSAAGTPTTNDFSADDDGGFWVRIALPVGNNDVLFTILDSSWKDFYTPAANELVVYVDGTYDTAMYRMAYPKDGTYTTYGSQHKNPDTNPEQVNDSVRIKDITLIEVAAIPDLTLSFEVQGMDGDGDTTQIETFSVFVSEDGSAV